MNPRTPIDYIPTWCRLKFIKQTAFSNNSPKRRREKLPIIKNKAIYECICGNIVEINVDSVKFGRTISCGCLRKNNIKHGFYYHPLYSIYRGMLQRCYDSNRDAYELYGGNGVVVCDQWIDNPKAFIEWALLNGWQKGLQLDKDIIARKNGWQPNLYSPDRCQFVTAKNNCNNRKSNKYIEYKGEIKSLMEWSEITGINHGTILSRLGRGWPVEKAFLNGRFNKYTKW